MYDYLFNILGLDQYSHISIKKLGIPGPLLYLELIGPKIFAIVSCILSATLTGDLLQE